MSTERTAPIPVLLDCDTGIDDSLAIIYLCALNHAGDIEIKGVSTTSGNVDSTQTAINSRYILNLCGLKDVPVVEGEQNPLKLKLETIPDIHGPKGLGDAIPSDDLKDALETRPWQDVWKEILTENPDTHVIVTGPATNLAKYIRDNQPPKTISMMGGSFFHPGNITATAEWNMYVDPHAAKEVFDANLNIMVCSLAMTEQFTIGPEELEELLALIEGTDLAEAIGLFMNFYFGFHDRVGIGYFAQIHDLLTCMLAMEKVPYETQICAMDVETESELMRGATVADVRNKWDREQTAKLVTSVEFDKAHEEFARALKSLNQHL